MSPGTVANHFGSARALASVATSHVLEELRMPTTDLFDGVEGVPERIRLLVRELAAFFRRSESWYRGAQREPGDPAWAEAESRYYTELDGMVRTALGPRAADADAVAVVSAGDAGSRYVRRSARRPLTVSQRIRSDGRSGRRGPAGSA